MEFRVRQGLPEELPALGRLVADVYASLPGMPGVDEQPGYYQMLREPARRRATVFAAVGGPDELLGCVDFIEDMKHYGSGGTASDIRDAAGIRLLAVRPECRGWGSGMETAWGMYEWLGFARLAEIDFRQGELSVFGFQLTLRDSRPFV